MYLEHFGLDRPPFKITPDTSLFFAGGSRGEILDAIVYAILSGEGIVKVVGEVGSGKTMLSRMLEVRVPEHVDIIYLANPSLAPGDILHAILAEMGVALDADTTNIQMLHQLQAELLRRHGDGRQVVCFVEEAQSMPIETLEQIRLLSNLETHQDKLLQIVLFGQPELDRNLDGPEIRQLRERIVHSFNLAPLGLDEIREYIQFRMQAAGYRGPDVFALPAYRKIAKASKGLVRRVNVLGDKALLAAYAANAHAVTAKEAGIAIADSEFGRLEQQRSGVGQVLRWGGAIAAGAALLVAGMYFYGGLPLDLQWPGKPPSAATAAMTQGESGSEAEAAATVQASAAPGTDEVVANVLPADRAAAPTSTQARPSSPPGAAAASGTVVANPAAADPTGANSLEGGAAGGAVPGTGRIAAPSTGEAIAARAPAEAPATSASAPAATTIAVSQTIPSAKEVLQADRSTALSAPASTSPAAAVVQSPIAVSPSPRSSTATVQVAAAAPLRSGESPLVTDTVGPVLPAPDPAALSEPRLINDRIGATKDWLVFTERKPFSIQLMLTLRGNWRNLEAFLMRWHEDERQSLYIFETTIKGRAWYAVLFNEFDSIGTARAAIERLPAELRRHKPFVRQIPRRATLG